MIKKLLKFPLAITLFFVFTMSVIANLNFLVYVHFPFQVLVSILIILVGVISVVVGGSLFRKAKTTVNPIDPHKTTQLVTNGIYSLSRNPMYIGFLLWLVGYALFLGNIFNFILLPIFVVIVNKLYILPEEVALEKLFGLEFVEYKHRVNRWL